MYLISTMGCNRWCCQLVFSRRRLDVHNEHLIAVIQCIGFTWRRVNNSQSMEDTKKCSKQILYHFEDRTSYRYLLYLAMILKSAVTIMVIFWSGNYIFFIPYYRSWYEKILKTLFTCILCINCCRRINSWVEWKIASF